MPVNKKSVVVEDDSIRCLRCGASKPWSGGLDLMQFLQEHVTCLPWAEIHDALQSHLVEVGHRGAFADEIAAGMVTQVKTVICDSIEE